MHLAAFNGEFKAIKALTEHGADIHTTTNVGYYDVFCFVIQLCNTKSFLVIYLQLYVCLTLDLKASAVGYPVYNILYPANL